MFRGLNFPQPTCPPAPHVSDYTAGEVTICPLSEQTGPEAQQQGTVDVHLVWLRQ